MGKKKKKLDLGQASEPLGNPFGTLDALNTADLPVGPDTVPPPSPEKPPTAKPGKGPELILRRETAGRGGKAVIVISRFPESTPDHELEELAAVLKKQCGAGGTVKNREIEIQGDLAEKVAGVLRDRGFRARGLGV